MGSAMMQQPGRERRVEMSAVSLATVDKASTSSSTSLVPSVDEKQPRDTATISSHDSTASPASPRILPALPRSLLPRRWALLIILTIALLDSAILPVSLFFIFKYAAHWTDLHNLAISNGVFGFFSIIQYTVRTYRLLQHAPTYRPLNSPKWAFDFYHWQFTACFIAITVVLSLFTGPAHLGAIGLMPSIIPAVCGPQFLFSAWAYKARWRVPIRMSSLPAGSLATPAVFVVVEDVVAVDGKGGLEWRRRWGERYRVSVRMRELMWKMTVFWGLGCLGCVGVACAVCLLAGRYVAFAFGWCWPFIWAGAWAGVTRVWVGREVQREREEWVAAGGVLEEEEVVVVEATEPAV